MAVAIGEIYQVTFVMQQAGQTVENVLHFRARPAVPTDAHIKSDCQDFWTLYRALISSDVTLTEIRAKRMTPVALDTLVFQPHAGESNGGLAATAGNSTLAAVVTLRTGVSGKRHRGRVYVPGISPAILTDFENKISSSSLTARDTVWTNIMALFDDATGTALYLALGIYSRLIGGHNPFTLAGWQAVTQFVNRPILGNQRRRREGVGA